MKTKKSLTSQEQREFEKLSTAIFIGTVVLFFFLITYFLITKKHNPNNIVNNNTYTISITNGNFILYTDTCNLVKWTNVTTGAWGKIDTNIMIIGK